MPFGIPLHQIHEAIERFPDVLGIDGDISGRVLDLNAAQGILGGNGIILGDFQIEFFAGRQAEPGQAAGVKLVSIAP